MCITVHKTHCQYRSNSAYLLGVSDSLVMISDKEEKEEKKKEKQKTEGCKGGKKTRKKLWFANFWQHVVIYEVY